MNPYVKTSGLHLFWQRLRCMQPLTPSRFDRLIPFPLSLLRRFRLNQTNPSSRLLVSHSRTACARIQSQKSTKKETWVPFCGMHLWSKALRLDTIEHHQPIRIIMMPFVTVSEYTVFTCTRITLLCCNS